MLLFVLSGLCGSAQERDLSKPLVSEKVVFEEVNGMLAVEAEHFYKQTLDTTRKWYVTHAQALPEFAMDPDEPHILGASNQAYVEILPDTRTTHDDKLIAGTNFMNKAGKMAILHYKVYIHNPGRYYVWVRTHSTGTEDNGIHVGIDDTWPEHGQRMQWTAKNKWFWNNKQRTKEVHTGVPMEIYLDINTPGPHELQFSMREDGFEFDKFILAKDPEYRPQQNSGPESMLKSGALPSLYALDGDGSVTLSGDLKQWHKVTLNLQGPFAQETDTEPNPFLDYNFTAVFTHESGSPSYTVPGYFAADGNAAESSAKEGNVWKVHFSPDKTGLWQYEIRFNKGAQVAVQEVPWAVEVAPYHGTTGSFRVEKSDKTGRDFRAKGRLSYVGKHHYQHQGSKEFFLKAGADAPETLLAYEDFDGTYTLKRELKSWEPHVQDWEEGNPIWQEDKGKGLIGALNYLASKGVNSFSFLTYNAGGDGDNVWPFVERNSKYHYDCSKLDQWQIVFDHGQSKGLYVHFKTQETENDDHKRGKNFVGKVMESLDGGELGPQRRLYYRELVARFGYLLGLNWNLGEENTQSTEQRQDMAAYFAKIDPYGNPVVLHTYPNQQENVYPALLGSQSELKGLSLQNPWNKVHERTLRWVKATQDSGKPLVICNDEQNAAQLGVPPDPGYQGFDSNSIEYDLHDIRKQTLWGNLMAGGAGVEYYFGYRLPENDLLCEDFRSRDKSWEYAAIALAFFDRFEVPFWEMENMDVLIGNKDGGNGKYCLGKKGELYLVYLGYAESCEIDLSADEGKFEIDWYNPRTGGELQKGSKKKISSGKIISIGNPPKRDKEDWVALIRKM
ncbi:MAG: DUF5060 domain-containing protein [Bacteroidota bacterium]